MNSNLEYSELTVICDSEFFSNDLNRDISIGDYLRELLCTLWMEGEGFSGKRPLGNSGWQDDIYIHLIKTNVITGVLDEYECIDQLASEEITKADRIMLDIIVEVL